MGEGKRGNAINIPLALTPGRGRLFKGGINIMRPVTINQQLDL
jgi:hypothetical protein